MAHPQPGTMTAQELLEGGSRYDQYELVEGTLVPHGPMPGWAPFVQAAVIAKLWDHVMERKLGWVLGSKCGFWVKKRPDSVLCVGVGFVPHAALPGGLTDDFPEVSPALAVEFQSLRGRNGALQKRGAMWIGFGSQVVWLVDPFEITVTTLRPGRDPEVADLHGSFTGAPLLPDLTIKVADLFEQLLRTSS